MKKLLTLIILACSIMSMHAQISYTEKKELKGYSNYIFQAEFSPFRNYFALTCGDNSIEIYDNNWKRIFKHQGNAELYSGSFAFSSDEKFMAYTRYKSKNDIAIIRLADMQVVQVLTEHKYSINDIEFSNNGKYLISCGNDKVINIWTFENEKFKLHQTLEDHSERVAAISLNSTDEILASVGNDKKIHIHTLKNGQFEISQTIDGLNYYINDVKFHPTANILLVANSDNIQLYKSKSNKFEQVYQTKGQIKLHSINHISFSATGDYFSIGTSKSATFLSIRQDKIIKEDAIYRHNEAVYGASFSNDGTFLTTCSADKSAIIWSIDGVKPSPKTLVADYLGQKLTDTHKLILSDNDVVDNILSKLDKELTRPRDEFETSDIYTERRDLLGDQTLAILQQQIIEQLCIKNDVSKQLLYIPLENIIGYNADKRIYKIKFLNTKAGAFIPIESAKDFKKHWTNAKIQAEWSIKKGKKSYTFKNFKLVHPTNGNLYPVKNVDNPFHSDTKETILYKSGDDVKQTATNQSLNEIGTTRILLFATNTYDNFGDLINPVNDATTIGNELQLNYECELEVIKNPTLNETITKIREYASREYSSNDNLLIFFAGHGIYDEVFKEGYIISKDSESNDLARTSYLSHSNLRTMINNIQCGHTFLIMDVCFGGTFDPIIASKSRAVDMYQDVANEEFISRKMKYKTRLYLTSGGKEYVPDGRPGQHSPFARKILEALRTYGGNDKILTVHEILPFVEKISPQPCFGEFGDNEPGSDFILKSK